MCLLSPLRSGHQRCESLSRLPRSLSTGIAELGLGVPCSLPLGSPTQPANGAHTLQPDEPRSARRAARIPALPPHGPRAGVGGTPAAGAVGGTPKKPPRAGSLLQLRTSSLLSTRSATSGLGLPSVRWIYSACLQHSARTGPSPWRRPGNGSVILMRRARACALVSPTR